MNFNPVRNDYMTLKSSILSVVLLAAGGICAEDWSTWRGDAGMTGSSTASNSGTVLSAKWTHLAEDDLSGTPVGGSGRIYAATGSGQVFCLDGEGREIWKTRLAGRQADASANESIRVPLAVSGKTVIACAERGLVYGLDADDGLVRWTYDAGDSIQGAPAVSGGKVFVLTQVKGVVHCISADKGRQVWVSDEEARSDGHPAVCGSELVAGNCNAMLVFISTETGRITGRVKFGEGNEIAGTPACSDGMVSVGTRSGTLMTVRSADREKEREVKVDRGQLFLPLAVRNGECVAADETGKLHAFSQGRLKWRYGGEGTMSAPVIAGASAAVIAGGKLRLLSMHDGREMSAAVCPESDWPPAVIDGMIVVAGNDSSVRAYSTEGDSP